MMTAEQFDVGVIGCGSATEALVRQLSGSGLSIVAFEPNLVGGECPFLACMPSKAMLHDAQIGTDWTSAVERRDDIVHGLDDAQHAGQLAEHGVELVRARAEVLDERTLAADGRTFAVEHLVIATGAAPVLPPIDGADECADAIWTSADAYSSPVLPDAMVIVGAGVIGMECATLYARYGASVTLIDSADRSFAEAPKEISDIFERALRDLDVDIRHGVEASSIRLAGEHADDGVVVSLSDDTDVAADRVLVAIGRRPVTTGFGLERLGLDPEAPLPIAGNGRVRTDGSVWAIGDVAGFGQYTHLANHHAAVVADHLAGDEERNFDDVVVPRCMFTDPPLFEVGPSWSDLHDDPDVVQASADLDSFPRAATDELGPGHLWIAARRSTGCLVAAVGAGPGFDDLVHAITIAIDGSVPVARLRQSMYAFPTKGEIFGVLFDDLHSQLSGAG